MVDALVERDHDRDVRVFRRRRPELVHDLDLGAVLRLLLEPLDRGPDVALPSAARRAGACRGRILPVRRSRAADRSRRTLGRGSSSSHSPSQFSISIIHPLTRWLGPSSSTKQMKPGTRLLGGSCSIFQLEVERRAGGGKRKAMRSPARRAHPPATPPSRRSTPASGRRPIPPGRRSARPAPGDCPPRGWRGLASARGCRGRRSRRASRSSWRSGRGPLRCRAGRSVIS